jgi:serine/threonine-protein kinase
MVGQTVGKYRVVSRLGRGGMGTVYKAVDETLDREVAIKSLNADLGDPDLLKRFRAEAITLARLNHPNIATLYELTEHDGQLLMVMEFVRGETFDKVSQREGPMPVARAGQLCMQVLDALEHAHRAGIVHRDLKPANMMLTQSGLVKVMDFGLARMMGTEHLTNDGYMVGTPAYMSPEQVLGREIDGRADLYAMGVVLFRLLTSELPFKADSGIAMVHHQLNDQPTPVRQLRSELSESCETLITRALAKSTGDRFQSAEEFKLALAELDPAVAATGISRVSSVAPVPVSVPVSAPGPERDAEPAEPTLPPTPTPLASSTAGLSPPTVVLSRADSSASTASPAPSEQSTTEAPTPAVVEQTAAAAPPAPDAAAPIPATGHSRAAATVSSAAPGTKTSGRNPLIPVLAVAAILLVAGVGAIVAWRAHRATTSTAPASVATPASAPPAAAPPAPSAATASTSAAPTDSAAPSAPGPSASAPSPASASAASATPAAATPASAPTDTPSTSPASPGSPPPAPSAPAATPKSAAPPASTAAAKTPPRTPPPSAKPAEKSAPPVVAARKPARPNVTFGKLKLLVVDDKGTRDRDVALRLGPDALNVVDGAATLQSASYQDVIGVYYTHAKEPHWTTPDGATVPVGKTGGVFGFFKGTPDWITVRTKNVFIPLRVAEDDVHRITSELEARTGTKAVTTK